MTAVRGLVRRSSGGPPPAVWRRDGITNGERQAPQNAGFPASIFQPGYQPLMYVKAETELSGRLTGTFANALGTP
jgi:hypothetical protein